MRRARFAVGLLVCWCARALGAALTSEPFSVGANGWGATNPSLSVVHTNSFGNPAGHLVLTVPFAMIPNAYGLMATGGAAAAAFLGDYQAAGAEVLSFDLRAESFVPETNSLRVNVYSGSNFYTRVYDGLIDATGVWYGFRFPLHDATLGGWRNVVGSNTLAALLTNVTRIEFEFRSSLAGAQVFRIDNIGLERLASATAMEWTPAGALATWAPVQAGRTYHLEFGTIGEAGLAWTSEYSFVATASVHSVLSTASAPQRLFRLRWP